MEKDIPLNYEALSREEQDELSIFSQIDIIAALKSMADNSSRAALYYGDARFFILTTVMGVNNSGLWLDQSSNEKDNRRIIESDDLIFVGSHLQVKVQFPVGQASSVMYQSYPAFHLPLPDCIYRLQRRDSFRITPPLSEPLRCVIPASEAHKGPVREVTLADISAGGIKFTCAKGDIDLAEGKIYENCQINLPHVGTINATVVVRSLVESQGKPGQIIQRAGCQFRNLGGASNNLLQRYVNDMQRAKLKK